MQSKNNMKATNLNLLEVSNKDTLHVGGYKVFNSYCWPVLKNNFKREKQCYHNLLFVICQLLIISNTMIFWKLVIKCPRKPREVCGIPEGAARGNSTNLPRVRDI